MIELLILKLLDRIIDLYWSLKYKIFSKKYIIDASFRFNGRMILLYGDGVISIGANSYIGELSTIQAVGAHCVEIHDGCAISHNVRIYTQSYDADFDFAHKERATKSGNVRIECNCWIGANTFISPGVVIGSNSVVGANSVVVKSIPPNEIWGGVPAKFIRKKALK